MGGDLLEGGKLTNTAVVDLHVNVVARRETGAVDGEYGAQWHDCGTRRAWYDTQYTIQ